MSYWYFLKDYPFTVFVEIFMEVKDAPEVIIYFFLDKI